jgi:hypothetical protein
MVDNERVLAQSYTVMAPIFPTWICARSVRSLSIIAFDCYNFHEEIDLALLPRRAFAWVLLLARPCQCCMHSRAHSPKFTGCSLSPQGFMPGQMQIFNSFRCH